MNSANVKFHFDNIHFDDPLKYGSYRVLQAGDLAAGKGYACENHKQVATEISYAVSGRAIFICDGNELMLKKGDICLNPKGSEHEIVSCESDPIRFYYLAFNIIEPETPEIILLKDYFDSALPGVVSADNAVPGAFQDILLNMLNEDLFSDLLITDALTKLLVSTWRSFNNKRARVYLPETQSKNSRLLSEICTFLDSQTGSIKILSELPARFGYSYSYISGLFSEVCGMSLRDYFLMRRHEAECKLLSQGLSVTAVAEKMDYSSVHAFSRAFSRREGVSPSNYAKSLNIQGE